MSPVLVASLTSLLEIYRRAQWNFLRVELEHLRLLKNFEPINGFNLPYTFELDFKNNKDDRAFMKKIMQNILVEKKTNQELLIENDGPNLYFQIEIYMARKHKKSEISRTMNESKNVNFIGERIFSYKFGEINFKSWKSSFTTTKKETGKKSEIL